MTIPGQLSVLPAVPLRDVMGWGVNGALHGALALGAAPALQPDLRGAAVWWQPGLVPIDVFVPGVITAFKQPLLCCTS